MHITVQNWQPRSHSDEGKGSTPIPYISGCIKVTACFLTGWGTVLTPCPNARVRMSIELAIVAVNILLYSVKDVGQK